MQSASWIERQKTLQLGRYGQGLCSHFMQNNSVGEVCVVVCVNLCMCVRSVLCTSFKLQRELHVTLAPDNHHFYAETLLEY